MDKKNSRVDIFTFGFALFSMFFGAGNLIFPPYLGVIAGSKWYLAFAGFTVTAVGLALIALIAVTRYECDIMKFFSPIGKVPSIILSFMVILCVGPLLVIPRTGATAYEMGVSPVLGMNTPITVIASAVVFYTLTYLLTVRPSKVVDIVGKFLTPFLIVALIIIIVKGVMSPIAVPSAVPAVNNLLGKGLVDGYQTMDCFVSLAVGAVLLLTLKSKGYDNPKVQTKMLFKSGVIATSTLALLYGGLTYLGATVSSQFGVDSEKAQIIVSITQSIMGNTGKVVLGIASFLACLTTAIGLTSASAEYVVGLTNGKIKYEPLVAIIAVFGAVAASIGVNGIVSIGAPILAVVYPPTIILIALAFFKDNIKSDLIYKLPVFTSVIISALTVLNKVTGAASFIKSLPLSEIDFNWVIPSLIAVAIGMILSRRND